MGGKAQGFGYPGVAGQAGVGGIKFGVRSNFCLRWREDRTSRGAHVSIVPAQQGLPRLSARSRFEGKYSLRRTHEPRCCCSSSRPRQRPAHSRAHMRCGRWIRRRCWWICRRGNGPDLASAKLKVEFSPVEGSPLAFGDREVPRSRADLGNQVRPVGRKRTGVELHGVVGGHIQEIPRIGMESHPHQDDRRAERTKPGGQKRSVLNDFRTRSGSGWPIDDALLQVD
jgi:hypothetical protein